MSRIISYILFSGGPEDRRTWDPLKEDTNRYTYNLLNIIVINSIIYPDFKMRIKTTPDYYLNEFLYELGENNILEHVCEESPFKDKAMMIGRLSPLWEDHEIVLTRDLDSTPSIEEMAATLFFINSNYIIQGIRSHPWHSGRIHTLLGGLSGYRPQKMKDLGFLPPSFSNFVEQHNRAYPEGQWGTELNILMDLFSSNSECYQLILDSPINNAPHESDNRQKMGNRHLEYKTKIQELFNWVDHSLFTSWAGEPVDTRFLVNSVCNRTQVGQKILEIVYKSKYNSIRKTLL